MCLGYQECDRKCLGYQECVRNRVSWISSVSGKLRVENQECGISSMSGESSTRVCPENQECGKLNGKSRVEN